MAEGTEPIRQDIESLRDSMSDTLNQIEHKVRDNVDQKVEQVRRTVDLRHLIAENPWPAVGIALVIGLWLGRR